MNADTKQQLMDKVIRAIERDCSPSHSATSNQLRKVSERIAVEVRKVEGVFQRAAQAEKVVR